MEYIVARPLPFLRLGDKLKVIAGMELDGDPLQERRILDAGKKHTASVDRCAEQTATQVQLLDRDEEGRAQLEELAVASSGQKGRGGQKHSRQLFRDLKLRVGTLCCLEARPQLFAGGRRREICWRSHLFHGHELI